MPIPLSTYRLQLRPEFGFDAAAGVAGYLAKLGVTHVYTSPALQAAKGSTHGYDIVDHSHANDELGGDAGFDRMCEAFASAGLGHIIDIVPNHMAIPGRENKWWWDVLRHGIQSEYSEYFDIDWDSIASGNAILLPVLGDHYGRVLEAGQLKLDVDSDGQVVVRYFDSEFPVDPRTIAPDARIASINGDVDSLDVVLRAQNYRLACWRVATDELDYRRFFDINSLIAIRQENPAVFAATHELPLRWLNEKKIDGLRIDHIDGLRDPSGYLRKLRSSVPSCTYIVVEKILAGEERLPATWPVEGTTGYEMIEAIDGLFIEPAGEMPINDAYVEFTGATADRRAEEIVAKRLVVDQILASDLDRLVRIFQEVCEKHRRHRDYTRLQLRRVLAAALIHFPVYRTYVAPAQNQITQADIASICKALEGSGDVEEFDALAFFGEVMNLEVNGVDESELVERFQQLSGAVMAKGVEDTACYRDVRFVALNEVGNTGSFAIRADDFHEKCAEIARSRPQNMVASTTHDTKRSEDVRHRLAVLSEMPEKWHMATRRWMDINDRHRRPGSDDERWPDRRTEYLLYQTLIGARPTVERTIEYMRKASKEAKLQTSWIDPDPDFDDALEAFIGSVMSDTQFLVDFDRFEATIARAGFLNSLAATAIKLTSPGVVDVYQGTEQWAFTLVDPDNRQLVDYSSLERRLDELVQHSEPVADPSDWANKMLLVWRCLNLRRRRFGAFGPNSRYESLAATGWAAASTVAFVRNDEVVTVVPRLNFSLQEHGWGDTALTLPTGSWRDVVTEADHCGETSLRVEALLSDFPVAVLERIDA